jgi:hypothetical protein
VCRACIGAVVQLRNHRWGGVGLKPPQPPCVHGAPPHWRSLVWAKGGHDPPCLCKFSTGNMLYLLKFNGLDLKKIPTMCKLEFWRPTNCLSCTQVSSAHRQQSSMHPACSSSLLDSSSLPLQPGNSFSFDHAMMSAVIFFDNNMLIY